MITTLAEFLSNRVLYRNLEPADPSLPGLKALRAELNLPAGYTPRKSEPEYGRVVAAILRAAQAQRGGPPLQRLTFIGDTHLLDATAYGNLCQAGGWQGLCFIGAENSRPAALEWTQHSSGHPLALANRWSLLAEFSTQAAERGFGLDAADVVVIDLDKTALGARGRNAAAIDNVRVQAVEKTVAELLGPDFNATAFRESYDQFNRPEFHHFTADNQDYLAYICLMQGTKLYETVSLIDAVRAGEVRDFFQFIGQTEARAGELPPALAQIHAEIYRYVQSGDPTPFKAFRRNEYHCTRAAFAPLPAETPQARRLERQIMLTAEVRTAALTWQQRGALLLGLSDKPDEAALPPPELAAQGYPGLHQMPAEVL